MKYTQLINDVPVHQPNARAEDGVPGSTHWNTLCEGVLIPLGSIFAVLLAIMGVMLIRG